MNLPQLHIQIENTNMSNHSTLGRPAVGTSSTYFRKYIDLVPDGNISNILNVQEETIASYFSNLSHPNWDLSYAPGKWTIKQSLLHIIDVERVMAYRALAISRGDTTPLPGFDQDLYAEVGPVDHRSGASLVSEYRMVRKASLSLFQNMTDTDFNRLGVASNQPASPLAIAYIIAGHELHHLQILQEKYAPLFV